MPTVITKPGAYSNLRGSIIVTVPNVVIKNSVITALPACRTRHSR